MTLSDHHASLALHPDVSILGVRLLPLSVGHAKLIVALGLDEPSELDEVLACALVCSKPAARVKVLLRSRAWRWWCGVRGWIVGACVRILSGRSTAGHVIFTMAAVKKWAEYASHYKAVPQAIPARSFDGGYSEREIHTPNLAHVEHVLCGSGLTPEQVDAMPLNEALWRFSVAKEAGGEVTLIDSGMDEDVYDAQQRWADENSARWIAIAGGAA